MSNTDYMENAILNHFFRNVAQTPASTLYLGLFTAAPGENGGGTEVTGNAYARQVITFAAPGSPGSPSAGQVTNSNTINFPAATPAGWGTIVYGGIFDALSGGNLLRYAAVGTPKLVNAGDPVTIAIGSVLLDQG